jgi:GntR family transcriptional regulator, transcriptional repressor for pyruvate dehydrogenase complex
MMAPKVNKVTALNTRRLVGATAEKMRDLILAQAPGALIGSLPDLAKLLGVGIATVQQAARVLEHEGLLHVRRGTGGGYFGRRPDTAALERSLAIYLRVRRADDYEALEMTTLLDCELMPAAALCTTPVLVDQLRGLKARVDLCLTGVERFAFEDDLHSILFKMVARPLMELLAQVAMRFYRSRPIPEIFEGEEGQRAWREWRHQIIDAILAHDPERARFEAERHRRRLLKRLARWRGADHNLIG